MPFGSETRSLSVKCNFRFVGAIAYFWLLLLAVIILALDFCLFSPLISRRYAYLTLGSMILYGAFLLRYTKCASLRALTGAIGVLYLTTALLLLVFGGVGGAHLFLIRSWGTIWLIAAAGFGLAGIVAKKWDSLRARRLAKWLAPVAGLSAAGCYMCDIAGYLNSTRASGHFSSPNLECRSDALQCTQVVSELEVSITPGTNLIWSAVSKEILDDETYLAFAGDYASASVDEINQRVQKKFGRKAFSPLETSVEGASGLLRCSYLSMNLPFKYAFQRPDNSMNFDGVLVESFTVPFGSGAKKRAERAREQVSVIYPPEKGNFIVELITRKLDHHLTLAQVTPEKTLADTVEKVSGYVESLEYCALGPNQKLEVPLFNFSIDQECSEQVHQNLRFQLDERGAVLGADASMTYALRAPPLDCTFDEPFLLMLSYKDNPQPYFAMWVDNAEILVKP